MAVPAFLALTLALSMANSTAALTATVPASLPPEAQAGGLALYNSVSGIGGYLGPAVFGWLKGATGSNAPGMVVRAAACMMPVCTRALAVNKIPLVSGFHSEPEIEQDATTLGRGILACTHAGDQCCTCIVKYCNL